MIPEVRRHLLVALAHYAVESLQKQAAASKAYQKGESKRNRLPKQKPNNKNQFLRFDLHSLTNLIVLSSTNLTLAIVFIYFAQIFKNINQKLNAGKTHFGAEGNHNELAQAMRIALWSTLEFECAHVFRRACVCVYARF